MERALDRGWPYSRIARTVGLSRQRVNQMLGSN
jgi:hypothetical protein